MNETISHIQRLTETFDALGIEFKTKIYIKGVYAWEEPVTQIEINRGIGYRGFQAEFYFNSAGEFLGHGVWED